MVVLTALCSALVRYTSKTGVGSAEVPVRRNSQKVKDLGSVLNQLRAYIFTCSTSLENAQATILKATLSLVKKM